MIVTIKGGGETSNELKNELLLLVEHLSSGCGLEATGLIPLYAGGTNLD